MIGADDPGASAGGRARRWRQPASLKGRMALLLGLVLIPPLIYSLFQTGSAYWAEGQEQATKAASLLDVVVAYQREVVDGARSLLDTLGKDTHLETGGTACDRALADVVEQNPVYLSVSVVDAGGIVRCGSQPAAHGISIADRGYFQELVAGRDMVVSKRLIARIGQRETIVMAEAVRRPPEGALQSAIVVALDLASFTRTMRGIDLPKGTAVHIFGAEGKIVGAELDDGAQRLGSAPMESDLRSLARSPREVAQLAGRDGVQRLFISAPIVEGALFAVVGFLAPPPWDWLDRKLLIGVLSPTIMLALAVLAIWIASDYLVNRHIRALVAATRSYGRGLGMRVPDMAGAPLELRALARSFTDMAARIEHREQELRSSLEQKDMMLREIHHRVKNNLQIVISLLRLRARTAGDGEARQVMDEVQVRIRALALVHRHLYEQPTAETVRIDVFVEELLDFLVELGTGDGRHVALCTDLAPVEVVSDQAIALALFVTEAVGNAQLHGFRGTRAEPEVRVTFTVEDDHAFLEVRDNGIGADAAQGFEPAEGMGIRLMRMLAMQLGGSCSFAYEGGTIVRLSFPLHDFHGMAFSHEGTPDPVGSLQFQENM